LLIANMTALDDSEQRGADSSDLVIEFFYVVTSWADRARRAGVIR
jgi:hypothetical protein